MAEWMVFVKRENARKAEETLRRDFDVAAKQSITVRNAAALGLKEAGDGSFFFISGSDEGIRRCQELIKDFVAETKAELLERAKRKIKEETEAAAAGMGGIFG